MIRRFYVLFLFNMETNHNRMANNEIHDKIQRDREIESVELFFFLNMDDKCDTEYLGGFCIHKSCLIHIHFICRYSVATFQIDFEFNAVLFYFYYFFDFSIKNWSDSSCVHCFYKFISNRFFDLMLFDTTHAIHYPDTLYEGHELQALYKLLS